MQKLSWIIISTLFFGLPAFSNDPPSLYFNAFDKSIYDQRPLAALFHQKRDIGPEQYDEELTKSILSVLYEKKVRCLEEKVFKTYDQELAGLKELMARHRPSTLSKSLKLMGSVLSTATSFALFGVFPEGAAARMAIGATAVASTAGATMVGIHEFLKPDGQLDLDKMSETLERKKQELIMKLNQEPISDLEIAYVLKKRFYSEPLQMQIEKTFIQARMSSFIPFNFVRDFLENCINLPVCKKPLETTNAWWNLEGPDLDLPTQDRTNARRILMSYNPQTRRELQEIITQITHTSLSEEASFRRFYVLRGAPGIGKSLAPKSIAMLLGLPYFETNIRTTEDISQRSLEGGDWQREMSTAGHIVRALVSGYKNGEDQFVDLDIPLERASLYDLTPTLRTRVQRKKAFETYENSVLVINDFDRLLRDSNMSTQVLSFLLDYFDPEKKVFFSHYFSAPIKTRGLIVFITANGEIPQSEEYDALRDRCIEIEFQPFEKNIQRRLLSAFFDKIQGVYRFTADDSLKARILESAESIQSLRAAKKFIEKQIIAARLANIHYEEPQAVSVVVAQSNSQQHVEMLTEDISFPSFQDPTIRPQVQNLDVVSQTARLLRSSKNIEQLESIKKLFGESSFFGYSGNIQNLWTSHRRGPHRKAIDNLGALADRLQRFETPQQRHIVLRFHLNLVRAIADTLLNFQDQESKNFIFMKIIEDRVRKDRLKNFLIHMNALALLNTEERCESVMLSEDDKRLIQLYARWFGGPEQENCKAVILKQKYKLNDEEGG